MDREAKIFANINRHGKGLEIGASYNPIATRAKGFNVDVLDCLPTEQLIAKYRALNVPVDNIQDVDYVWSGEPYSELIGARNVYDWIIASHIIEHTPDFVGFLNECDAILKPGGVLSLVVPDVRYHFDYFRPLSGISKIIDAHVRRDHIHTEGSVAEFMLNFATKGGHHNWDAQFQGELALSHTLSDVIKHLDMVRNSRTYVDVHAWQFTPTSFRLLVHDLHMLGFIALQEISFYPSWTCEFYITLGRTPNPPLVDRLEFLKQIRAELLEIDTDAGRTRTENSSQALSGDAKLVHDQHTVANRPRTILRKMKQHATPILRRIPFAYPTARSLYRACRSIPKVLAGAGKETTKDES